MEVKELKENENGQNFLAFYLDGENYGFPILKVNEVIVLPKITPIPKSQAHIKGVINLRGQIIPIVDLRAALDMSEVEYGQETCVIVVKVEVDKVEKMVGFIVDSVSEVFEIPASNIEKSSCCGEALNNSFLQGIGKVKDKIIMLLDIDKVLSENDKESFMFYESDKCTVE